MSIHLPNNLTAQLADLAKQYDAGDLVQKIENYKNALAQLEAATAVYSAAPTDTLYRDGLLHRFEFTVELACKSMKEYLEDQGIVLTIASPRRILKEAYAVGVVHDEDIWIKILTAHNLTSDVYDEATADEIAHRICSEFLAPFTALAEFYSE